MNSVHDVDELEEGFMSVGSLHSMDTLEKDALC